VPSDPLEWVQRSRMGHDRAHLSTEADTAAIMRRFRLLASLALVAFLTTISVSAHAQDAETATSTATPLALAPDGQLPLQGTPWRLRGYRWRGSDRAPGPEVAARMTLGPGSLDASGGCTAFSGRYGAIGRAIHFELRDLKDNSCGEQTTVVQLAMVDGLRKAASFDIGPTADDPGDRLVLRSATGVELLRFDLDEDDHLDRDEWRLASYSRDGQTTAADLEQPAVLTFRAKRDNEARRVSSGPASGSTGCNGLVGDFFRHADVISFGELERTDAPCSSTLAAQEAAILEVLGATSQWLSFPFDGLVITSAETGASLEFVNSRPVQGSTWLLDRIPGSKRPTDAVTLRMSEGLASGEGPCGAYSAAYVSDGRFITFSALGGAEDDACDTPGLERALLSALRSTVRLEREEAQLLMLDARGSVTARFESPAGP
jgi:heat shock protein HslJ